MEAKLTRRKHPLDTGIMTTAITITTEIIMTVQLVMNFAAALRLTATITSAKEITAETEEALVVTEMVAVVATAGEIIQMAILIVVGTSSGTMAISIIDSSSSEGIEFVKTIPGIVKK